MAVQTDVRQLFVGLCHIWEPVQDSSGDEGRASSGYDKPESELGHINSPTRDRKIPLELW